MNTPHTQLKDIIHVEKGIIPSYMCEYIMGDINKGEWDPHTWRNPQSAVSFSEETRELDVQEIPSHLREFLIPIIIQAGALYNKKYAFPCDRTLQIMYKFSSIRLNRYSKGQMMRQHHDHIHDLFDGTLKGIPVLSFILNFNDDYEGAELFFWKDTVVKLGKGDICMFPSNFLFPHGVTEATKGIRYSAVCWGW